MPLFPNFLAFAAFLLASPGPANAEQLYACVQVKKGTLRLVASPDECKTGKETSVSWNLVGPQGPVGPPGPTGAMGTQGLQGEQGEIGPQGLAGPTGSQGSQGQQGFPGVQGEQGPSGPPGPPGNALRLVDNNGQDLGLFLGWHGNAGVEAFYEPVGAVASFTMNAQINSADLSYSNVFWDSPNCSGQAYVRTQSSGLIVVRSPGRFYTAAVGASASPTVVSEGTPDFCNDGSSAGGAWLVPAQEVTDLVAFDLPVALPLRIVPQD